MSTLGLQSTEALTGVRIYFQGGSLMGLGSWCWPVARGSSSSPCMLLHRAAWASSQYGGHVLPKFGVEEHDVFYDLTLEVTHCHFCLALWVTTQTKLGAMWEGTT